MVEMHAGQILLAAIIITLLLFLLERFRRKATAEKPYDILLRRCLGDAQQAERLIEAERNRYPNASRDRLIKHAVDRWKSHSR